MHKPIYYYLFVICIIFQSCITGKESTLLQGAANSKNRPKIYENNFAVYRLQPRDVISVRIKSSESVLSDHLNINAGGINVNESNPSSNFLNGYSITDEGNIHLPDLGEIKVAGLTVEEVRDLIQRRVDEDLTQSTAFVNLISFKVAILGEVRNPGYYYIYNNQGSILEGIALAGGMMEFANPKAITLVRQSKEGNEAILIDLTDPNTLQSPYYYLRPNDALYIRPSEVKFKRSNLANLNIASVAFAGISTAITVILLIRDRQNNTEE